MYDYDAYDKNLTLVYNIDFILFAFCKRNFSLSPYSSVHDHDVLYLLYIYFLSFLYCV